MKVTEIKVTAARTFNNPLESYSNLRPAISLTATLDAGDDPETESKALQAKAERLIEEHKQHLLASLEQIEQMQRRDREVASLERQITTAQERLVEVRAASRELPSEIEESF